MYQKLDTNADHYSTAILRKAYVTSRCEGDARRHLVPRLRPESHNLYNYAQDMLAHLQNIFSDPNKGHNARRQYNNLKIAPKVEAGIDPDYWREDLYQRLPFKLQELTISPFNGNEVDFDQYVEECARSADLIDEILKRCNCTGQTPSSGRRQSLNAPTTANRTSPAIKTEEAPSATSETSMDTETRNRLMNEGKCFRCQRPRISAVIVLTRNPYK
ncbi:hypothetical protein AnigIFM63309_009963 [Aspergillus niger]|nr:hypothetical protein AnigIFM63309_009963 [Aspergillus niger]